MIQVNGWAQDYVNLLFKNRGFDPEKEEVFEVIETQWENWKRLLVQSGLNADKSLADDVAYEFSTKRVIGGAPRIFEHFADFVLGKPKQVREFEAAKYTVRENVRCDFCDGRGVVMIPMTRERDGITQTHDKAFKCECEASMPYSSLILASAEMLEFARRSIKARNRELSTWAEANGLDESRPAEFRRRWAKMFTAKSIFSDSNKNTPRFNSEAEHEESDADEREIVVASIPDDRAMALAAYTDGDERGWDF